MTAFATTTAPAETPSWWRRLRPWIAVGLLVLTVVAVSAVYRSQSEIAPLDPDAASPEGSRALAVLLRDRDVRVDEFDQVDQALAAAERGDVTLLVPFPELLGTDSLEGLADLPESVRVVLVQPDDFSLKDLDLGIERDDPQLGDFEQRPGCELPEAVAAGVAEVGLDRYKTEDAEFTCYDRSLVVVSDGGAEVVVLGAQDPLTNDRLDDEGNASLSLGLLNEHDRVIWLIPDSPELDQENRPAGIEEILPAWTGSTMCLLFVAALLAALWRARRLGPPVVEPLPVVVRSAETVEGRARLYRSARASAAAYEALRAGALARLLPAIGLGGEPDYRAVVEVVAARSGRPADEVHALLYGPPPTDDAGLVTSTDLLDTVVENTLDPTHVETARHRLDGEGRPQ
jgi:hypothetical protein